MAGDFVGPDFDRGGDVDTRLATAKISLHHLSKRRALVGENGRFQPSSNFVSVKADCFCELVDEAATCAIYNCTAMSGGKQVSFSNNSNRAG